MINVAADGTTAVTRQPERRATLASQGNLLKAENNWWGLRFNSHDQPRPGDLADDQPAGARRTRSTARRRSRRVSGGTTSNAVDFFPYRSGPQSDPTNGQFPILTAPIPVDDAAPTVTLAGPASAGRGTTITLTAAAVRRLRRQARALRRGRHHARHRHGCRRTRSRDDPGRRRLQQRPHLQRGRRPTRSARRSRHGAGHGRRARVTPTPTPTATATRRHGHRDGDRHGRRRRSPRPHDARRERPTVTPRPVAAAPVRRASSPGRARSRASPTSCSPRARRPG